MKKVKRKDSIFKFIIATSLSLVLTACGSDNNAVKVTPTESLSKVKSAIVVGAGLSGLTAAYELEQIGFEVTVIEAKDRIGGRVGTLNMGEQHGEIGGEFIDGKTVHTYIHQYASQFGVELADTGYSGDTESGAYFIKGKLIGYTQFDNDYDRDIVNDLNRFYDELDLLTASIPDPDQPAELDQAKEYDLITTQSWIDQLNLNPSAKLLAEQWVRGEFDEPSDLSLLHVIQYKKVYESVEDDDIEAFRFLKGGKAMVDAFADNIEGEIILSQPVTNISQVDNLITVTTSNGDTHTSDVIVVTVPLGVLDKINFNPTLPETLSKAAQALNYGSHSKVLLKYDT
jgi:monoamine oxidase